MSEVIRRVIISFVEVVITAMPYARRLSLMLDKAVKWAMK